MLDESKQKVRLESGFRGTSCFFPGDRESGRAIGVPGLVLKL